MASTSTASLPAGVDRQGHDPRRSSARSASAAASATSSSTPARRSARLSMEGRMTVCNMSIEAGARAGMIAPDDDDVRLHGGPPHAPQGRMGRGARRSGASWQPTPARPTTASFTLDAVEIAPHVTWGTEPSDGRPGRTARVPDPATTMTAASATAAERALEYMGLERRDADRRTSRSTGSSSGRARTRGSRTCASPPRWCQGKHVHPSVRALVVPGSVARQASRRRTRAWTRSSRPPGSNGARPAARCAWA